MIITSNSYQSTQRLGKRLGAISRPGDVFLMEGELGSGKTSLTQGIAQGLGINDYVRSPTFVMATEYHGQIPLYHIDLYRISSVPEAVDLGLDEYFQGEGVSVVEWADIARNAMPNEHMWITIKYQGVKSRQISFYPIGERYEKLIEQLTL